MTIQECYRELGGDFAQVEKRLTSVSLVKRFITKFLDDSSFSELCVSANLGFDRLQAAVGELTELLRPETGNIPEGAAPLLEAVRREYELTAGAIRAYLEAAE